MTTDFPDLNIDVSSFEEHPIKPSEELPRKHLLAATDEPDVYTFAIDNSSMEVFLTCERSSFFKLLKGRSTYPSAALIYGSALHKCLDAYYLGRADLITPTLDQILPVGLAELSKASASVLGWRNEEQLTKTLRLYLREYANEELSILGVKSEHQADSYRHAVELPFQYQLGTMELDCTLSEPSAELLGYGPDDVGLYVKRLNIFWTGRIDMLAQVGQNLWVLDHKTTSIGGPSYFAQFHLSSQFHGYAYIASKLLGRPITGAIANVIFARQPTRTGKDIEFHRLPYGYSEASCLEWKADMLRHISTFIDCLKTGQWPKRTISCTGKYGACPYMTVCQAEESLRPHILYSDTYARYVWDPRH